MNSQGPQSGAISHTIIAEPYDVAAVPNTTHARPHIRMENTAVEQPHKSRLHHTLSEQPDCLQSRGPAVEFLRSESPPTFDDQLGDGCGLTE